VLHDAHGGVPRGADDGDALHDERDDGAQDDDDVPDEYDGDVLYDAHDVHDVLHGEHYVYDAQPFISSFHNVI
jgi:hypothetical protein